MRLKVRSSGPHEYKNFELCVKNQCIWKNNSLFPLKSSFFLMFAGRVFETPVLDVTEEKKTVLSIGFDKVVFLGHWWIKMFWMRWWGWSIDVTKKMSVKRIWKRRNRIWNEKVFLRNVFDLLTSRRLQNNDSVKDRKDG